jgi:plasmid stabilization system protein ParE
MVPVIWAEPALADLEEIYRFIAKDSPQYARSMVERLTTAAARLGDFPQLGEIVPQFAHRNYRQLAVGAYRLGIGRTSTKGMLLCLLQSMGLAISRPFWRAAEP